MSQELNRGTSKKVPWWAIIKLTLVVVFLVLIVILAASTFFKSSVLAFLLPRDENVLLTTRYKSAIWKGFGNVFEPKISLPVHYPEGEYREIDFLLDSGAIVSSLPREEAEKLGLSLAKLPRLTFTGFGNAPSFAYQGEIRVLLGQDDFVIPVVFTEAAGTKPLLGRSGFFEEFSVYFNHRARQVQIKR